MSSRLPVPTENELNNAKYLLVSTLRSNGRWVPTPVWAAYDDSDLLVWTDPNAGKVKRVRNNGRARVAVCDMRGKLKSRAVEATGRVLAGSDIDRAMSAIKHKYGTLARIGIWSSARKHGSENLGAIGIRYNFDESGSLIEAEESA